MVTLNFIAFLLGFLGTALVKIFWIKHFKVELIQIKKFKKYITTLL